jgi:hypothetical protein
MTKTWCNGVEDPPEIHISDQITLSFVDGLGEVVFNTPLTSPRKRLGRQNEVELD